MDYFSKEKVNTGRQLEVDMLKAFCIVCMIFDHVYEELAQEPAGPYVFFDYTSIFIGAAAFMLCMGIGMRYSRQQEPGDFVKRGLELLTIGQLLNIVRGALPSLIAYWVTGRGYFLSNSMLVIQADILSFAGIAFIFLALLKRLCLTDAAIPVLGLIMNILTYMLYLNIGSPDSFLVSQLLGYFVMTEAESFFTLGSYFVFVAAGYYIGGLYPRIRDKDGLANRVLMVCIPFCAIYYAVRMTVDIPFLPEFNTEEQYILTPGSDAVATCMVSLILLALFYKLLPYMSEKLMYVIKHLSVHINDYYCISYMFIIPVLTVMLVIFEARMPGWVIPFIYGIFVTVCCYFIIELNDSTLHLHFVTLKGTARLVTYSAIWALTFIIVAYVYPRITEYATFHNGYLLP